MGRTVYLGKIFGIEFRLHYTWFIIFFLVTFLLVEPNYGRLSYWLFGICSSLLLFVSVLAHELAHSLVGRANGIPVSSITLFIFGGVALMKNEAPKPGAEFRMAIAGPVCSLVLGGIFWLLLLIPAITGPVVSMITWLAIMNGSLAVFNLIPGFPLDGGRVLRSMLWRTTGSYLLASRIATIIGQGFGYLFIVGGILIIFLNPFGMSWYDGMWVCFIGWFLSNAASSSYRQIKNQPTSGMPENRTIVSASYTVLPRDDEGKE
jgi:Zn-dependent protease